MAPDTNCNRALSEAGKAYPRTCQLCGLGPCRRGDDTTGYVNYQSYASERVSQQWTSAILNALQALGVKGAVSVPLVADEAAMRALLLQVIAHGANRDAVRERDEQWTKALQDAMRSIMPSMPLHYVPSNPSADVLRHFLNTIRDYSHMARGDVDVIVVPAGARIVIHHPKDGAQQA